MGARVTVEEWAVGYTVKFADGGALSCVLAFGTKEQTSRAAAHLAGELIRYTGPRVMVGGVMFACEASALA